MIISRRSELISRGGERMLADLEKNSLYYQCSSVTLSGVCRALADVYYAAVRAFGGSDETKRSSEDPLVLEYEEKLAVYNQLVEEARAQGLLPDGV